MTRGMSMGGLGDPRLHAEMKNAVGLSRFCGTHAFHRVADRHRVSPKGSVESGYVSVCVTDSDI